MSTVSLQVKQLVQYAQQATGLAATLLYAGYLVASLVTLTFRESRAMEANKKRLEPKREELCCLCMCKSCVHIQWGKTLPYQAGTELQSKLAPKESPTSVVYVSGAPEALARLYFCPTSLA